MIQPDLMDFVGGIVIQNVLPQARKTSAGNDVYRLNIESRSKVQAILTAFQPYIVGEKTQSKVNELLGYCQQYCEWLKDDGKSKAAKRANRARKPR